MNGFTLASVRVPASRASAFARAAIICAMFLFSVRVAYADGSPPFLAPELVYVGGGTFVMGDSSGAGQADERPAHAVKLKSFFIGAAEVTRAEYGAYAQDAGLAFEVGPDTSLPVTSVSWADARSYAKWLARRTRQAYRLPTEAEWEYAARAKGVHAGQFIDGNDRQTLCTHANIADSTAHDAGVAAQYTNCSDNHPGLAPKGSYLPNAIGLRDVSGNAWEWTQDCYTPNYEGASATGRARGGRCTQRVIRGGSFRLPAESARLSNREAFGTLQGDDQIGFRVARDP
jgi:sulfatase modifying factor 1